jgi:hypothetical protein
MALKTYPNVPVFMPIITKTHKVTDAEGTANSVDIAFDRPVAAVIVQVQAPITGEVYATGLTAVITTVETAGSESCKVTVTGTDIVTDMIINVIAF